MNQLSKYDVIIFDCDGVIFDSNKLKIDAMRESLDSLSIRQDIVEQCCSFFAKNFGKSRFYHVEFFVEHLINVEQGKKKELYQEILDLYANKTRQLYMSSTITPHCIDLLDDIRVPKFIASGSEEGELRWVFEKRGLSKQFDAIYGSPTSKSDNVRKIIESGHFKTPLMVGDALSDLDAAISNGIDFLGYLPFSNVREELEKKASECGFVCISDWPELSHINSSIGIQE